MTGMAVESLTGRELNDTLWRLGYECVEAMDWAGYERKVDPGRGKPVPSPPDGLINCTALHDGVAVRLEESLEECDPPDEAADLVIEWLSRLQRAGR
jgi:hypothetical protein